MGALLLKLVIVFFSSLPLSVPLPFAIFHGLGDSCSGAGINSIIHYLNKESGEEGFCVEIGNGRWDSLFMPLQKQTDIACEKVKKMEQLRDGFNVVGFSQGNLIARGVIEFCDGAPLVKNFISICGPHAGIAAPVCKSSGYMCRIFNRIIKEGIYSDFVQNNIAVSGYCKTPTYESYYLKKCRFLPKLNNERSGERHATYKKNFSNLTNLVLIMSKDDSVLKPRETSWFGYYLDGSFTAVLNPLQTTLYIEDWIGLQSLVKAGRVQFVRVEGEHLGLTVKDFYNHVVPYLRA